MKKRLNGTVTVLFSFVLVLLLSLVLVSVESARQQAAVAVLQTEVSLAMDSLSGQYYTPLFDRYGIYGIYGEDAKKSLTEYIKGSADPLADLPEDYSGDISSGYGFGFSETGVSIAKQLHMLDLDGDPVRNQMISAGAVNGAEDLVEELLETLGILKEQETGMILFEEKAKTEEKLTAMDLLIMKLITAMDGIPTNYGGIVCDKDGKVQPERYFAKTLVAFEPTRQSVAVDSFAMFMYLLPEYNNLLELTESLREDREYFEEHSSGEEPKEWRFAERATIRSMLDRTIKKNEETISILSQLILLQEELKPLLTEYREKLNEAGGLLSEEWKEALGESIDTMQKYAGKNDFYDFRAMRLRVEKNSGVLKNVRDCFEEYSESTADNWREILRRTEEEAKKLSFEGLNIHYSGMRKTISVKESLWNGFKNIILQGLTSGILDSDGTSAKKMTAWQLPSNTVGLDAFDLFDLSFDDIGGIGETNFWKIIRDFRFSEIAGLLRQGAEELTEKVLLTGYTKTTFADFTTEIVNEEENVLDYQLEYILFGKKADQDNLRRAAASILGIRLLLNVIHTFTNPMKKNRAMTTAIEIFGDSFPFLIKACTYVILFSWGLQNARLEAAEILKGKRVPFLVTASTFQVSYEEILTMNKEIRMERAEQYEDAKGVAPNYGTYLTLFLLLSKERNIVFRSMDLMQEQIRRTDNPDFRMADCLCGLAVTVRARLPGKYTDIPMIGPGGYDGCTVEVSGTFLY
ncbi:MAG: hypothetical protein J5845_02325 [Lachnospiraceae bacterium]|nr:hypothetical protein [Lachnospiraceae bacterium]